MASSQRCGVWRQCLHTHVSLHHHHLHHHDDHHHQLHGHFQHQHQHHQHHHHHLLHHHRCPLQPHHHHLHLVNLHSQVRPNCAPPFHRNPEPFNSFSIQSNLNLGSSEYKEAGTFSPRDLQEQEHEDLLEEEDDEPVFVLTDEWREFFAKSEARRLLDKKQRKKGKE